MNEENNAATPEEPKVDIPLHLQTIIQQAQADLHDLSKPGSAMDFFTKLALAAYDLGVATAAADAAEESAIISEAVEDVRKTQDHFLGDAVAYSMLHALLPEGQDRITVVMDVGQSSEVQDQFTFSKQYLGGTRLSVSIARKLSTH